MNPHNTLCSEAILYVHTNYPGDLIMAEKKKTVDEYVAALPVDKQPIVAELRKLIKTAVPEVTEAFKWGQPVYESNGPLPSIDAFTNQVNFGVCAPIQLADPPSRL